MLGVPFNTRVKRTLGVTLGDDLTLTIAETPTGYFPARVVEPEGDNGLLDGSPRTSMSVWRMYWQGALAPLGASHRVEDLDGTEYELISPPRKVSKGRQVLGRSAPMLPVELLYPRVADLKANNEAAVLASVRCAIYSERESKGQRGAYHDTFCEIPASAWQYIDGAQNLELHFDDGSVWKPTDLSLSREVPFVTGSVRRAG